VVTNPTRSGLDLRWVDAAVRPQDDLFTHLNGVYLREHEMPADRSQDGAFRDLRDRAEEDVRAIVDESASADGPDA
jgi:putative endopeptidase